MYLYIEHNMYRRNVVKLKKERRVGRLINTRGPPGALCSSVFCPVLNSNQSFQLGKIKHVLELFPIWNDRFAYRTHRPTVQNSKEKKNRKSTERTVRNHVFSPDILEHLPFHKCSYYNNFL